MKILVLLCFILSVGMRGLASTPPDFTIKSSPSWKKEIKFELRQKDYSQSGEISYLLIDWQENEAEAAYNYHYYMRLNNETGVQNNSQLYFSFDPSYQQLAINKIRLYRDGKVIDQLDRENIEVMRNETNVDRLMYDGTYSAVAILKDVRIGDVLEYEITLTGKNPIWGDHFYGRHQLAYNQEIDELYQASLLYPNQYFQYKLTGDAEEPVISQSNGLKCLEWHRRNVKPIFTDEATPGWYAAYPVAEISTFKSWPEVKKWESKLFDFSILTPQIDQFIKDENYNKTPEDLIRMIRFVQKDIRYLGMEMGIFSHQPHHPAKILNQRFGDCKDKSYLLATMLRKIGVEAWPALVNTTLTKQLPDHLPSSLIFDHVIVKFRWDGKDYWVDATDSGQKGGLDRLSFPLLGFALVIDGQNNGLEAIPVKNFNKIEIEENYWVNDSASDVTYQVLSSFYGDIADIKRSNHQNISDYKIRDNYLNFYSSYLNNVAWGNDTALSYVDNQEDNIFTTTEKLVISDLWKQTDENDSELYASFNPFNMYEFLTYTKDQERSMPLNVYHPVAVDQTITIHFPRYKVFNLSNKTDSVVNDIFRFVCSQTSNPELNQFSLHFTYETKTDYVPVDQMKKYFEDYNKLSDLCKHNFYWGMTEEAGSDIFYASVIFILLLLGGSIWGLTKLYRLDLGTSFSPQLPMAFGGWLIIPIIGLHIIPLICLSHIVNPNYFSSALWQAVLGLNPGQPVLTGGTFFFELFYNAAIIVFSTFLLVLMYQRRSIFPMLYIALRVFSLSGIILDEFLMYFINGQQPDISNITREIIYAAVWIPYFALSERVKETFTRTYHSQVGTPESKPKEELCLE